MKPQNRMLLISALGAVGFWIVDSIIDIIFFTKESFLDELILNPSPYEIYIRSLGSVFFLTLGIVASRFYAQRIKDESKLRRLAAIVESSDDAIISKDLEGIITSWNKGAEKIYGYSETEVIGQPVSLLVPPNRKNEVPDILDKIRQGEHIFHYETIRLRKDRSQIHVSLTMSPIVDGKGAIIGASTIASDVTERRKVEEALQATTEELDKFRDLAEISNRLAVVGQMAAGIAHEINNPLTSLIGFSELLLEENLPPNIKDEIKIIADGGNRVKSIVQRMLLFAHQTKPMQTKANINDIVEIALGFRDYALRTANIVVEKHLAAGLPDVSIDAGQMQQVFVNIILNAEYAMKKARGRGILTVTTEKKDNHILISFKDDGTGMSQETKNKLFSPFFTTKQVNEGAGLGLSLSRSIILEHGGTIEVESEPGKGATFIILLPITTVATSTQPEHFGVPAAVPAKAKSARILVVDDEITIRKLLSAILTNSGHSVDDTGNSEEALKKLDEIDYDAIFMDIRMPGKSGMELYAHVKDKHPKLAGKFIFITGDTSDPNTSDFLTRNDLSFINKPFNQAVILGKLNKLL